MNTRAPWQPLAPPTVEIPAPASPPRAEAGSLLRSWAAASALLVGATSVALLLMATVAWNIAPLTCLLGVLDLALWGGTVALLLPLRQALDDYRLRQAAQWQEHVERGEYLLLGRRLLLAWGRKSYGRGGKPLERVVWVRDGNSPVAPSNGRVNTSSAEWARTDSSESRSAAQGQMARVATGGQTADDETRPLGELAGPAVWTPAMSRIYELWQRGADPSARACEVLGISRGDWNAAMSAFVGMGYVDPPTPGKSYKWRV